jgi:hypothetical protein
MGKSRLVAEARSLGAAAGLRVLTARGGEREHEFSFGIVRQLFEPILALAPRRGSARSSPREAAALAARSSTSAG